MRNIVIVLVGKIALALKEISLNTTIFRYKLGILILKIPCPDRLFKVKLWIADTVAVSE